MLPHLIASLLPQGVLLALGLPENAWHQINAFCAAQLHAKDSHLPQLCPMTHLHLVCSRHQ